MSDLRILSLNCQKNYNPNLAIFLNSIFAQEHYDIVLLQELTKDVRDIIAPHNNAYTTAYGHAEDGRPGLVGMVYKNSSINPTDTYFEFWSHYRKDEHARLKDHVSFGVFSIEFSFQDRMFSVASIHLPSSIQSTHRVEALQRVRDVLTLRKKNQAHIIFGGDCNFGYPWERRNAERLLHPDYICITKNNQATLDGYYSEYANHLPNKIARLLARLGIHIKLHTDHFFINNQTEKGAQVISRVLSERVSDHSPVELTVRLIS